MSASRRFLPGVVSAVVAAGLLLADASPARATITRDDIFVIEDVDGSILEAAGTPNDYLAKVACRMRQVYPGSDRFDAIFVFSGIPLAGPFNVQQGWPVMNQSKGIGRGKTYNSSVAFCSANRLRQAVKMGDLSRLPDDPDAPYRGDMIMLGYALSGIELMAHEFGHHWLAAITFDKGDGTGLHCLARAYSGTGEPPGQGVETCDGWSIWDYNQHWSYLYNSRSVMYGNFIEDLGGGSFRFWYEDPKFSELDQYLMGLRGPGEVPPQFIVLKDDQNLSPQSPTANEWVMEGADRMDFTVQDVIRAEGERIPAREPCHWKGAMILVWSRTAGGLGPAPVVLDKMVTYGNRWEEFYDWATDHRGSFDLTRDGRGHGTGTCPNPLSPPGGDEAGGPDEALPDAATADVVEVVAPADDGVGDPGGAGEVVVGDEAPGADPATDRAAAGDEASEAGNGDAVAGTCTAGRRKCHGAQVMECRPDGQAWTVLRSCADFGMVCEGEGSCVAEKKTGGSCTAGIAGDGGLLPWSAVLLAGLWAIARARRRPGQKE